MIQQFHFCVFIQNQNQDLEEISALLCSFPVAMMWKQSKCPSTDEWMKKTYYIRAIDYFSDFKKKEILQYETGMNFEDIMLSEISHLKKTNIA